MSRIGGEHRDVRADKVKPVYVAQQWGGKRFVCQQESRGRGTREEGK